MSGAARHPQRSRPGGDSDSGAASGRCKLHKRANSGQKNAAAECHGRKEGISEAK
jgi:hypothetical protein